jgi:SAM-dependent methyltransferase
MREADAWWSNDHFWEEMFDFIFPPEHLGLGQEVAEKAAALLGLGQGAAVLDLGCGPGRVSVPLARMGYRVVGVDVQASYLARARDRAAREGVALELHQGDIADIGYRRDFDAAISIFTSFGYFADRDEDERVLQRARRALRPGGRFLLETAHRDGVVRLLRAREGEGPDGRRYREEPRFDPVAGVLEARWTVTSPAGARSFVTRMRAYSATELASMLHRAGFGELRFYSGFDGEPPSLDHYTITAVAARPR